MFVDAMDARTLAARTTSPSSSSSSFNHLPADGQSGPEFVPSSSSFVHYRRASSQSYSQLNMNRRSATRKQANNSVSRMCNIRKCSWQKCFVLFYSHVFSLFLFAHLAYLPFVQATEQGPSQESQSSYLPSYTNHHQSQPSLISSNYDPFQRSSHLSYFSSSDHVFNEDDSDENLAESTPYAGPLFVQEPSPADRVSYYSNKSHVTLECRASGYPVPGITWRVDNMTLHGSGHRTSLDEDRTHFYSTQLNTVVHLRHDGQTLIIGGGWSEDDEHGESMASYHHSSLSHRVECLASNQFGSIISRPVMVQQQKQSFQQSIKSETNSYGKSTFILAEWLYLN